MSDQFWPFDMGNFHFPYFEQQSIRYKKSTDRTSPYAYQPWYLVVHFTTFLHVQTVG